MERLLTTHRRRQPVQQIEQRRIDHADIVAAEIAQQVIDRRKGVGQVATGSEVFDAQLLVGVQVVETQGACRARASVDPTRRDSERSRTQCGDEAATGEIIHDGGA